MAKEFDIEDLEEPLNFYAETHIEDRLGASGWRKSRNHVYFAPDVDKARQNNEAIDSICGYSYLSIIEETDDLDERIVHLQELAPDWTKGDNLPRLNNLCGHCSSMLATIHETEAWDGGYR